MGNNFIQYYDEQGNLQILNPNFILRISMGADDRLAVHTNTSQQFMIPAPSKAFLKLLGLAQVHIFENGVGKPKETVEE